MGLEDVGAAVKYLIRDRDGEFPALLDQVLVDTGIEVELTGVRMPRMNSIMERWNQTCPHELLDRTLIWSHAHLLHALRQFEIHYNTHRAHRTRHQAAPLQPKPQPITKRNQIIHLDIRRHDRLGGNPARIPSRRLTCTLCGWSPIRVSHGKRHATCLRRCVLYCAVRQ